ncbi:hypothetical protein KCP71_22695 [Salmonella enterica subsp. enterica]|nr:hypothetical protein KCP71_22695 [Salmonella enterica subsp. enterica]
MKIWNDDTDDTLFGAGPDRNANGETPSGDFKVKPRENTEKKSRNLGTKKPFTSFFMQHFMQEKTNFYVVRD